jgi:hypothetical protein
VSSAKTASRARAWVALLLGLLGVLTLPAAVEVSRRSARVGLLDASYAIPLAFALGLAAAIMARRARRNLRWLDFADRGTRLASLAVVVGTVALCLALTAALSVGFYELVLFYQHHR